MKKIVASVGLVALGASSLHAADASSDTKSGGFFNEDTKLWTLSASLRGFYDDNINSTAPTPGVHPDSFGFEVSPSVMMTLPLEQNTLSLAYVYAFKDYDNRPLGNANNYDQTHTFNASWLHQFSTRYRMNVSDSFVIGQEPDLLRAGNSYATFERIPGDNIRNFGSITFNAAVTRLLELELGYANAYYDYAASTPTTDALGNIGPSSAGVLDRQEHVAHLDTRWQVLPDTTAVIGYQYREVDFTGNEPIAGTGGVPTLFSADRNSRGHYAYIGADHEFRPDLTGSIRLGGSYYDYFHDPNGRTDFAPYALASLRWQFASTSFVEIGASHDRSATDLVGSSGVDFTLDSAATSGYINLNHRLDFLSPKLASTLQFAVQNSDYNGGAINNFNDKFYTVGVNFTYSFTRFLAGEVGYDYDQLDSDILGRSFNRNRVYLGVIATY